MFCFPRCSPDGTRHVFSRVVNDMERGKFLITFKCVRKAGGCTQQCKRKLNKRYFLPQSTREQRKNNLSLFRNNEGAVYDPTQIRLKGKRKQKMDLCAFGMYMYLPKSNKLVSSSHSPVTFFQPTHKKLNTTKSFLSSRLRV